MGCAFLAKQTGGAVLLPVLWLCGASWAGLVGLGLGAVLPVLLAALLTDPSGFLFWTVTGSGAYASFTGSELHVLGRALTNTAILTVACAGVLPLLVRARRPEPKDLWLWLAASGGAVALGFHFFGHYYLQLTPPLALLATAALRHLPRPRAMRALITTACCATLFLTWGLLTPRPELTHAERLAEAIGRHTAPQDRILVWGIHPETYWLSDRTPATRYLTAGLLTNYSGGRDGPSVGERYAMKGAWTTLNREFATDPPRLIIDDSRGKPYAPERIRPLRRLLEGYEEVAVVDGAVLHARVR